MIILGDFTNETWPCHEGKLVVDLAISLASELCRARAGEWRAWLPRSRARERSSGDQAPGPHKARA